MTKIDKVVYTAKAHTTGGREGGASRTDDGRLEVRLSTPGTPGTGTNPEQLFAAGWSACFLSAIKLAAGKRKICRNPNLSMVVSEPRSDVFDNRPLSVGVRQQPSQRGGNMREQRWRGKKLSPP